MNCEGMEVHINGGTILISEWLDEFQEMRCDLNRGSLAVGFKINMNKRKLMPNRKVPEKLTRKEAKRYINFEGTT